MSAVEEAPQLSYATQCRAWCYDCIFPMPNDGQKLFDDVEQDNEGPFIPRLPGSPRVIAPMCELCGIRPVFDPRKEDLVEVYSQ